MKIYISGYAVSGSPQEIATMLKIYTSPNVKLEGTDTETTSLRAPMPSSGRRRKIPNYTRQQDPMQATINDSQRLRQELEVNPNYNPYPGVVTPPQADQNLPTPGTGRLYGADHDTGIER